MNAQIQVERSYLLKELHIKGQPVILLNIWDGGSARALQGTGAKAVATSSWAVAASHGYADGEKLPFDLVLANIKRIIANIDLPVTIDLEGGYAENLSSVYKNVANIIAAGVAGLNFEDQVIGGEGLYPIDVQCMRIKTVHTAALDASIPIFINARTDIFLKTDFASHKDQLKAAICRANAYAESGADGFFVPGLCDLNIIQQMCKYSPIPINVMVLPDMPSLKQLAELGVARISYGASPYFKSIDFLQQIVSKALLLDG